MLLDTLEPLSLLVGAALGAILSTLHGVYIRRPRVNVSGGGAGSGVGILPDKGFAHSSVSITNSPRLLGLRIGETAFFGMRIHRHFRLGFIVETNPAIGAVAILRDGLTNRAITQLSWQVAEAPPITEGRIDIKCRDRAQLIVFTRKKEEPRNYFPYIPVSHSDLTPRVPDDDVKYSGDHRFILEIRFENHRPISVDVQVEQTVQGTLFVRYNRGGTAF